MVYVWTLSDPETRVKIQGDSRTLLGSPGSSGEVSPGLKGPLCASGRWPHGDLALQQTSALLVWAEDARVPSVKAGGLSTWDTQLSKRVSLASPLS